MDGKLRLIDIMEAGSEACNNIEAYYEFRDSKQIISIRKLRLAKKAFDIGYRRLCKIFYNV